MVRNINEILLAILLDVCSVAAAVLLASYFRVMIPLGRFMPEVPQTLSLAALAVVVYSFIFISLSIYDPDRVYPEWDNVWSLVIACFVAGLALAGIIYFSQREISRLLLVYYFILHFAFVFGWRPILRRFSRLGLPRSSGAFPAVGERRVLVVGSGQPLQQVLEKVLSFPPGSLRLVGYLSDQPAEGDPGVPHLGPLQAALPVTQQYPIDDIWVALPAEEQTQTRTLVASLIETPCNVWVVPDYYNVLVYGGEALNVGGILLISLKVPTLTGYQRMIKRAFDLVVGSMILILISPFMLCIAAVVALDSRGPVFFKQARVGENRRVFGMYKFRSMVADAEKQAANGLRIDDNGQIVHKSPNDPRVTRVGRWLRRTSMDELPQLWNVLRGEMSLVGPRPELPALVAQYEPWQQKRFAVPQGMTGWWQVNGRSDRPMHLNTQDDLYYVQHYSIWLDLQILIKTAWVVWGGRGAY